MKLVPKNKDGKYEFSAVSHSISTLISMIWVLFIILYGLFYGVTGGTIEKYISGDIFFKILTIGFLWLIMHSTIEFTVKILGFNAWDGFPNKYWINEEETIYFDKNDNTAKVDQNKFWKDPTVIKQIKKINEFFEWKEQEEAKEDKRKL